MHPSASNFPLIKCLSRDFGILGNLIVNVLCGVIKYFAKSFIIFKDLKFTSKAS